MINENHMIGKGLIFLGSVLLLAGTVFGQGKITVSGTVSEKGTGEPVIGATILIKGLQGVGTVTNIDGNYTLGNVAPDATLVFSFVGMKTVEQPVNGRKIIDVVMEEDSKLMDEVVVVGMAYNVNPI